MLGNTEISDVSVNIICKDVVPLGFRNSSCFAANGTANTTFAPASPSAPAPTASAFTGDAGPRYGVLRNGICGVAAVVTLWCVLEFVL